MSSADQTADVPRWLYLVGVISILFVIYVWQAPLDWFVEFMTGRIQPAVTPGVEETARVRFHTVEVLDTV